MPFGGTLVAVMREYRHKQFYSRTFSFAVYRHGKGRLIVSTMPLDPSSPAGATILANARQR